MPAERARGAAERGAAGLLRRPRLTLALVAAAALLAAPALRGLRFDSSVERLSVEGDGTARALADATATFGSDDVLVIAQLGDGPAVEAGRLARLRALGEAVRAVPGVERIWSLTATGHLRGTSDGVEVRDLVEELPGDGPALAALRAEVESSPLYRDHVLSRDGRAAAIVVFPETSDDPFLRDRVVAGIRAELARYPGPERVVMTGNPSFTVDVAATLQREQNLFSALTVVALAGILGLLFRSPWAAALPLVGAGVAIACVLAGVAAAGRSISVLAAVVPSMVLALGMAYAMHLLCRYAAGRGSGPERARRALADVALPVALSAATTLAGFASLLANRIAAIREFGLLSAAAVAAAALGVLVVVPAGLAVTAPRLHAGGRDLAGRFLAFAERTSRRREAWVFAACAGLLALAALGAARLAVDTAYVDFLRPTHPANLDRETVLAHLAGPIPLLVLLDAGARDAALEPDVLRRVAAFQRQAAGLPHVHASFSLADLLAEMNRAWHVDEPEPDRFRAIPDGADATTQLLLLYESSAFASDLDRIVDRERRRLAVWVRTELYHSRDAAETAAALRAPLERELGDLRPVVTGTLYRLFQSSDEIALGQARSLALAVGVIGAVVAASLRSLRLGLIAAAPDLLPVALLFGAMGWLGVPLDVGTCVVACLVLGVATDDTIHFITTWRAARAGGADPDAALRATFAAVGRPILYTSLALCAGFAVLALSEFRPIAELGWLTAGTMLACLLGDLMLLPALLRRFGG